MFTVKTEIPNQVIKINNQTFLRREFASIRNLEIDDKNSFSFKENPHIHFFKSLVSDDEIFSKLHSISKRKFLNLI